MSYSKRARKGLAVGVFLFLSLVVFGAMYYIAFCACNVEVLADSDEEIGLVDFGRSIAVDPNLGIRRGPIEIVPDYNPYFGIRRGPIEIVPDYNPFLGISRPPIMILPI